MWSNISKKKDAITQIYGQQCQDVRAQLKEYYILWALREHRGKSCLTIPRNMRTISPQDDDGVCHADHRELDHLLVCRVVDARKTRLRHCHQWGVVGRPLGMRAWRAAPAVLNPTISPMGVCGHNSSRNHRLRNPIASMECCWPAARHACVACSSRTAER